MERQNIYYRFEGVKVIGSSFHLPEGYVSYGYGLSGYPMQRGEFALLHGQGASQEIATGLPMMKYPVVFRKKEDNTVIVEKTTPDGSFHGFSEGDCIPGERFT